MSNIIVDGFATYGTTPSTSGSSVADQAPYYAMLSGAWADVPGSYSVGALPWTPEDDAIYIGSALGANHWPLFGAGNLASMFRRVLPAPKTVLITSFRLAVSSLPSQDNAGRVQTWMAGAPSATDPVLFLQSSGYLVLRRDGVTLASTQVPVVVAQAAHHIETLLNVTNGTMRVLVDGQEVINVTGLLIPNAAIVQTAFIGQSSSSGTGGSVYLTDLIIRDTAGGYNNTIMGDRRVATLMVNRDDPLHQGWSKHPLQRFGAGILANVGRGSNGVVYAAASTQTDLGSGDFTIEGNFRIQAAPTGANKAMLFGKWSENNNQRSYRLYIGGPALDSGMLTFQRSTDGTAGTIATLFQWPWQYTTGEWYHIAVSRASGVLRVFVNGVQLGLNVADASTYFAGSALTALLGQANSGTIPVDNTKFNGWVDEFRLTVGTGRYTANFAPPSAAFPRGGGDPNWAQVMWLSGFNTGIFDESSIARTLTSTSGFSSDAPVSVTPNDLGDAYLLINKKAPPLDYSFIEAALIPASGLFALSGLPANNETVTVGTKDGSTPAVYRWRTVLATAFDVLIGASPDDCLLNLVAAINKEAGEGTTYGTGTTVNWDVISAKMPTTQILATALIGGTAGNSIASTDTTANGSWGAATLAGGANIPPYSQFGVERPPNNTTVIDSLTMVMRAWKTDAGPAKVRQSFVAPGGAVADGTEFNVSTTPTLYFDTLEVDPDTNAPLTPTTVVNAFLRVNRTL